MTSQEGRRLRFFDLTDQTPFSRDAFSRRVRNTMARRNSRDQAGFTLIELIIAIAILGLLAAIALPYYQRYVDNRDIEQAKSEILRLEHRISQFFISNNKLPTTLEEIEDVPPDPWGNDYVYLLLTDLNGKGQARKDKKENPVNSDYDLYSMGKDGKTQKPFSAKAARDDIVRANNGRFVGLADDY